MNISVNKTKILAFSGLIVVRCKALLGNKPIEVVGEFKCLGNVASPSDRFENKRQTHA
jgi:hypothetical protein